MSSKPIKKGLGSIIIAALVAFVALLLSIGALGEFIQSFFKKVKNVFYKLQTDQEGLKVEGLTPKIRKPAIQ